MKEPVSGRAKLVLFPHKKDRNAKPGLTDDDYAIYASYRPHVGGGYVGTLKVVRLTDARLLFPFEGAEDIGPFDSKQTAKDAAVLRGREIVQADLQVPEL
ncbi:hypothetical protein P9250_15590 [Caballeronia sp. LP006]|jgi:hypothetical protein|uniref:DUF6723 family protein n=1 Tax=unclassified Caballeronia TaxID=2646786 RepID=UPI001FD07B0E|nr:MULTISPECIES: DUF6723 family protein [unclassified Caballeronia]MDR5776204.1 hypothetical protein [Caballeronia sp. LZ002]MDR5801119.1 hypothetical protein [Caballeronia sp. LZ001]MDR5829310.1 hypothetical protein [Caballeronia sp. LP006]MDR5851644.1 hypothetical protein [Caballeronia sp. LZ003]